MKVIDKKIGDTIYYKYRINLPIRIVEESKFEGKTLEIKLDGKKIIISKK